MNGARWMGTYHTFLTETPSTKTTYLTSFVGWMCAKEDPPPLCLGRGSYLSAHAQAWCAMKRARLSEVDSVCMRSTNI